MLRVVALVQGCPREALEPQASGHSGFPGKELEEVEVPHRGLTGGGWPDGLQDLAERLHARAGAPANGAGQQGGWVGEGRGHTHTGSGHTHTGSGHTHTGSGHTHEGRGVYRHTHREGYGGVGTPTVGTPTRRELGTGALNTHASLGRGWAHPQSGTHTELDLASSSRTPGRPASTSPANLEWPHVCKFCSLGWRLETFSVVLSPQVPSHDCLARVCG